MLGKAATAVAFSYRGGADPQPDSAPTEDGGSFTDDEWDLEDSSSASLKGGGPRGYPRGEQPAPRSIVDEPSLRKVLQCATVIIGAGVVGEEGERSEVDGRSGGRSSMMAWTDWRPLVEAMSNRTFVAMQEVVPAANHVSAADIVGGNKQEKNLLVWAAE